MKNDCISLMKRKMQEMHGLHPNKYASEHKGCEHLHLLILDFFFASQHLIKRVCAFTPLLQSYIPLVETVSELKKKLLHSAQPFLQCSRGLYTL